MTKTSFLNFVQRHHRALIWFTVYCIMILLSSRHQNWGAACILSAVTIAPLILNSVGLTYFLLPRFLHRRPVLFAFLCLILMSVLVLLFSRIDPWCYDLLLNTYGESIFRAVPPESTTLQVGTILLHGKYAFLLLCTSATLTIDFLLTERRKEAEAFHDQQMQEQLKYLRAQINPHFLFNALNCIYALTMTQDEQAPDSVLKLSEMLRYVIDDCRADKVPLTKEVKYIRNYIDFQRIRMEHEPNLTLDVQIVDAQYTIPPMILQPIIENCFKHSRLIDDPNAWIHILIRQNESGLLFTCDNSKPSATNFSRQSAIIGREDEERTGIGLMNVQQRLAMLFGDKCSLKVIEDNTHYKTILHI